MLFSYLLVFILIIKAFVGCTTTLTLPPTAASATSTTSATSTSSDLPKYVPVFIPLTRPRCVLQNADSKFTFQVEKMLMDLRGDNTLPEQFRQVLNSDGSSVWVVAGDNCELRLTPRLSHSQLVGLPQPVIERLWALGLQGAIRNIYFECVKYGHIGGAQVWSWRGTEHDPVVDVEIAILRMHRRQEKSCFPRSRSCVVS